MESDDMEHINLVIDNLYGRIQELERIKIIDKFMATGLTEWEKAQAEQMLPTRNIKIPVSINDPYGKIPKKVYMYGINNFPKLFSVPYEVAWAAYANKYQFHCTGSFLFVTRDGKTYDLGFLQKKSTNSKKKVVTKNRSNKFFK